MKQKLFEFYKGKKILITGHTGFKGSWLSYWLYLLGADVYGYALESETDSLFRKLCLDDLVKSHIYDIRDKNEISEYVNDIKPDMVFHLAAQALVRRSYDEPHLTFETNVIGSLNLLEAIRKCDSVRSLVYITSDKCYWNSEWVWGYREIDPLGGADPYSASKASAEHVFKSYYLSYFKDRKSFACGSTRAGNVIGGGDYSENRIVPDIIKALEKNESIILRHPHATRPWQHVLDPLNGYITLGKHLYENPHAYNGEAWNFGPTNQSIKTVLQLTETLVENWSDFDKAKIETDQSKNQPYESTLLHLSIDKAQTLLGWSPSYQFYDAVSQTGDWYKKVLMGEDASRTTEAQIKSFMDFSNAK